MSVTLVLGGARSGKSRYAEQLVTRHPPPWTYIATAQAFDAEMIERIALHQARRTTGWQTVEAPQTMPAALARSEGPVLVDCLTLWLSNLMLAGEDLEPWLASLDQAIEAAAAPVALVSNEVGLGLVPETPLGRAFRDEQGRLNARIAARADHVLFLVAGLPMVVK